LDSTNKRIAYLEERSEEVVSEAVGGLKGPSVDVSASNAAAEDVGAVFASVKA
jgi:hypothetical protein